MPRAARDHRLLDALEPLQGASTSLTLWRACFQGREPTNCSASGGRWDDGSFDVLYTSAERDGAIAEMHFHVRRGQPVIPSRIDFHLYELRIDFHALLDLSDRNTIEALGVDLTRFGSLVYGRRTTEYARTQQIGEVAQFLDFDGLMAPSARHDCANVVVFCDKIALHRMTVVEDHGRIDWDARDLPRPTRIKRPTPGGDA